MCTDVSFWKPIEYNITTINCCNSRVELKCTEYQQEVCVLVEEMECEVGQTFLYYSIFYAVLLYWILISNMATVFCREKVSI